MQIEYSLNDPAVIANPYPMLHRLRVEDPVHWSTDLRGWVVTRYDDVKALQTDKRMSADRVTPFADHMENTGRQQEAWIGKLLSDWAVFSDPPKHTILRRLMVDAFTPRAIDALRPTIQGITDDLLDEVSKRKEFDLIGEFAYPLPATVIAHILGVPTKDVDQFRGWSDDLAAVVGSARTTDLRYQNGYDAIRELTNYFRDLIHQRRNSNSQNALMDQLIKARDADHNISEEELVASCVLILFAGHETTTNLIGNGMISLLQHPDQLATLRKSPSLIETAIEEMLRFECPVQVGTRIARENITLRGQDIRKGDRIFIFFNSANRDPEVFPDPDQFDIQRTPNRHLSFGYGIHFCIGAQLARIEGQVAILSILDRFPNIAMTDSSPVWDNSLVLRGVKKLTMSAHAALAA